MVDTEKNPKTFRKCNCKSSCCIKSQNYKRKQYLFDQIYIYVTDVLSASIVKGKWWQLISSDQNNIQWDYDQGDLVLYHIQC